MRTKKTLWEYIIIALPALVAVVCLFAAIYRPGRIVQAAAPIPAQQVFVGEYSRDGDHWSKLTEEADISALKGDLMLRGHFSRDIPAGVLLNCYKDHIGLAIYVNGELWGIDIVSEIEALGLDLEASACGRTWYSLCSPGITVHDRIEIYLHNPHDFGNRDAYRYFLMTLCNSDSGAHAAELWNTLRPYGTPARVLAVFFVVAALIILGVACAAAVLREGKAKSIFGMGLTTLFAGGFIAFDTIDASFWSGLLVLNTHMIHLCKMMFVCCMGNCIADVLRGKRSGLAKRATGLFAGVNVILFALSASGVVLIYDTGFVWTVSLLILMPLLFLCCASEFWEKKGEAFKEGYKPISGLLLSAAVLMDVIGIGSSILSQAICTKVVFLLTFLIFTKKAFKNIVQNNRASALAEDLKVELESSRTAIMLSQIRPHFLHNSLGVIQELCHTEPLAAEDAIGNFAQYLKGNMSALDSDELIPFKKELEHAKCYLEIEKLRFGDQLKVEIQEQDVRLKLPALTIQPLAENAVRHGARKREDGGTVSIYTLEYPEHYEVVIEDDGPGFDPEEPLNDGKLHVGIPNVRDRLIRMCGGDLRIESTPDIGTRAIIILPKEMEEC